MKKLFLKSAMLLAALTLVWGCGSSSDDEDTNTEPTPVTPENPTPDESTNAAWTVVSELPSWTIDWSANDPRPDWTNPDAGLFENWMIVMVKLPEDLIPFVSAEDMMAVFISGELRGVSSQAVVLNRDESEEDKTYFIIKAFGYSAVEANLPFTVKYYSSKLKQLFSVDGNETFIPEGDLGVSSDYVPPLLLGASNYPVIHSLFLNFVIDDSVESPFIPSPGDLIGIFINGECRGYTHLGASTFNGRIPLTVYSKEEGETMVLRYFSTVKWAVRDFPLDVKTKQGTSLINITI